MPAVGAYLREIRERQGISIDEIARSTRVLHHYLEALESDDLASLPAPVFAKGFIRAYCQALGVAPHEGSPLYAQPAAPTERRAPHIEGRTAPIERRTGPSERRPSPAEQWASPVREPVTVAPA